MPAPPPIPSVPVPRPPSAAVPTPSAPTAPGDDPHGSDRREVEHAALTAALAGIADLDERPLAEHHERLSRAHEALHAVLDPRDA